MFSAGIADKLGNGYEAKWVVRLLLDVALGKAEWLRYEGITNDCAGFECSLKRDGVVEWHQSKINNTRDNWTIGRLNREGVLSAFARVLTRSRLDRCLFVSDDPARVWPGSSRVALEHRASANFSPICAGRMQRIGGR